jgi:5-methylcytosine-specific restriction enzyme A
MGLSDLTPAAVNEALDEFDQLGRDAFLKRYGMGAARGYYLVRDGRRYVYGRRWPELRRRPACA